MARAKRPIKWTGGAVIVALIVVGLLGASIYYPVREIQLGMKGVSAVGKVIRYEKRGRSVYWTIRYENQGQQISADVEPSMFSGLELDKDVAILYDPQDPKRINVDNFWHRYFYQTLGFGLALLFLAGLPILLWQSDDAWLLEYATRACAAAGEHPPPNRIDQFVTKFWLFHLATGSVPRGAIAEYFQTYGPQGWSALKAAWDKDAVPSFGPVVAEIDRIIAGREATQALTEASPGIEKFYVSRSPAILGELRDYVTDPDRNS